ncbi:MAG: UDP-N-acetylmuramoyl-L-alanyl-D-glutamate--2,6-diaminopimelate ligase, partial [Oscillospiraceae bacterium]|nr:UDP-N-acetylmuramoyl-L-alanyl-D-glutamate--2,6-diaminopimelate ligase [Oscillospiraceae bacterium]
SCEICFMEVSSHALDLGRADGIRYDIAVFTNLSQDHLDYHADMEAYYQAKRRLFDMCGMAVINTADGYGKRLFDELAIPKIPFLTASNAELNPGSVSFTLGGSRIVWRTPGAFSVDNALAAVTCGKAMGFTVEKMAEIFGGLSPVKGRMEPVDYKDGVTVLIDYAHTPDALENVLRAARGFTEGRLICVVGCGGNRDKDKRPQMGRLASTLSDLAVITSDNPRFEKPESIIGDILAGCKGGVAAITDRREAIAHALDTAVTGDVVMLCGKGHETYQEINGQKYHMDEREIVKQCIS